MSFELTNVCACVCASQRFFVSAKTAFHFCIAAADLIVDLSTDVGRRSWGHRHAASYNVRFVCCTNSHWAVFGLRLHCDQLIKIAESSFAYVPRLRTPAFRNLHRNHYNFIDIASRKLGKYRYQNIQVASVLDCSKGVQCGLCHMLG